MKKAAVITLATLITVVTVVVFIVTSGFGTLRSTKPEKDSNDLIVSSSTTTSTTESRTTGTESVPTSTSIETIALSTTSSTATESTTKKLPTSTTKSSLLDPAEIGLNMTLLSTDYFRNHKCPYGCGVKTSAALHQRWRVDKNCSDCGEFIPAHTCHHCSVWGECRYCGQPEGPYHFTYMMDTYCVECNKIIPAYTCHDYPAVNQCRFCGGMENDAFHTDDEYSWNYNDRNCDICGEFVPAGQCHVCGDICYYCDHPRGPIDGVDHHFRITASRGWTCAWCDQSIPENHCHICEIDVEVCPYCINPEEWEEKYINGS